MENREYRWWHKGISLLIPIRGPRIKKYKCAWTGEHTEGPCAEWKHFYFRLVPKWSDARQAGEISWYEFIVDRFEGPFEGRRWWVPTISVIR
jgi:hypothetical protein